MAGGGGAARLQRAQERRHAHGHSPGRGPPSPDLFGDPPLASGSGTRRAGHSRGRLRTPRTARDKDPRCARGAPLFLGPLLVQTQRDRCGSPKLHGIGGGGWNKSPSLPGSAKSMGSVWLLKSGECASNPPAGRTAQGRAFPGEGTGRLGRKLSPPSTLLNPAREPLLPPGFSVLETI